MMWADSASNQWYNLAVTDRHISQNMSPNRIYPNSKKTHMDIWELITNRQLICLLLITLYNLVIFVIFSSPGVFDTSFWKNTENDLMNGSSLHNDSFNYAEEELETPLNLSLLELTNELAQLEKLETSLSTLFYQTLSKDHVV